MQNYMCKYQDVILETRLNLHLSRCINSQCTRFAEPINGNVCKMCPHRVLPDKVDEKQIESVQKDIFNPSIKKKQRTQESCQHLFDTYCKKCVKCDQKTRICEIGQCDFAIPINELMISLEIHCPLELW